MTCSNISKCVLPSIHLADKKELTQSRTRANIKGM